jgi:hypothetical protein
VFLIAMYFTFFFSYRCSDISCFQIHQEKCVRAKFLEDTEDITWFYKIKGKEDKKCKINAEILQVKEGSLDKIKLEGTSMDCYLQIGDISLPESDLSKCHGILKEELQEIIINNAHRYIIDNIGKGKVNEILNNTL